MGYIDEGPSFVRISGRFVDNDEEPRAEAMMHSGKRLWWNDTMLRLGWKRLGYY